MTELRGAGVSRPPAILLFTAYKTIGGTPERMTKL